MPGPILAEQPPIRVKQCRHGLFMYNMNDEYIGRSLDIYGEFSEQEASLFHQIIKPGMVVLDIGANIGAHTIGIAKIVGGTGQVVAFEPQRVIQQMLCGNLALNGLSNTLALMIALGKQQGMIEVPRVDYGQQGNFGGVALTMKLGGESVPLLTIDSFNFPRCDFIKLDVEGMEQDVLEGAVQTLARCNPILYVENDRREKSPALIELLFKQGYRLYWHLPPLFNAENYFGESKNIFPTIHSINMLGIPKSMSGAAINNFVEITPENAAQYIDVLE